ncbi:hypothetical protein KIPB_013794, partial [Kipferlia bialata]
LYPCTTLCFSHSPSRPVTADTVTTHSGHIAYLWMDPVNAPPARRKDESRGLDVVKSDMMEALGMQQMMQPPKKRHVNRGDAIESYVTNFCVQVLSPGSRDSCAKVSAVVGAMGSGKSSFMVQSFFSFFGLPYGASQKEVDPYPLIKSAASTLYEKLSRRVPVSGEIPWSRDDAKQLLFCTLYLFLSGRVFYMDAGLASNLGSFPMTLYRTLQYDETP